MIFNELYGSYYKTVAKILEKALEKPMERSDIRSIIEEYAFGESGMYIEAALMDKSWPLLHIDGTSVLEHRPSVPLTMLQKRWMKTISLDPRMRLFGEIIPGLEDIDPLFTMDDIVIFDKYSDGDPYHDESYVRNFRLILDAIKNNYPIKVRIRNRKGTVMGLVFLPEYLEYSEKDDKFRVIGSGKGKGDTINLGRILTCEKYETGFIPVTFHRAKNRKRFVELEVKDERKALERVLLHFAHLEKQVEREDTQHYKVILNYDKEDETEILIRILSFGPMVRVVGPEPFVNMVKKRLRAQMECDLGNA